MCFLDNAKCCRNRRSCSSYLYRHLSKIFNVLIPTFSSFFVSSNFSVFSETTDQIQSHNVATPMDGLYRRETTISSTFLGLFCFGSIGDLYTFKNQIKTLAIYNCKVHLVMNVSDTVHLFEYLVRYLFEYLVTQNH